MMKIPLLNIPHILGYFLFVPSHCLEGDTEYRCRLQQFYSAGGHVVKGFCLLFCCFLGGTQIPC